MDFSSVSHQIIAGLILLIVIILVLSFSSSWWKVHYDNWRLDAVTRYFLNSPDFHVFPNVNISTSVGDFRFDYLLVGQTGLFVVDAYHFFGRVKGEEKVLTWFNKSLKKNVDNPLYRHKRNAKALNQLLGLDEECVFPILLLVGPASIKHAHDSKLVKIGDYQDYVLSREEYILTAQKVKQVVKMLSIGHHKVDANEEDGERKDLEHVGVIESCPRCGSEMIMETVEEGPEMGQQMYRCSLFPTCKGTVNLTAV